MRQFILLSTLVLAFVTAPASGDVTPLPGVHSMTSPDPLDCIAYDKLLRQSVMTSTLSYLADNSFEVPDDVTSASSPARLFDVVYGGAASSIDFVRTIVGLTYVSGRVTSSRAKLREHLYLLASSESYGRARTRLGELLLTSLDDVVTRAGDGDELWRKLRCLPEAQREEADLAIGIELSR